MRIIFVRHGEPDYINDRLTENGVVQADATAERLKDEKISAIYSSPLGRAFETASHTAKRRGLEVKVLDFMREIDWGSKTSEELEFDGHPWTLGYKLLTESPDYIGSENWREHEYFRNNICMDSYADITNGLDGLLEKYGIVREGRSYRVVKPCDDTIAIFAHGGSGAFALAHLFNLPLPFVLTSMPFGVCSITSIDLSIANGDVILPRFELFNDMEHLGQVKKESLNFGK